jgi:hypothetical protein
MQDKATAHRENFLMAALKEVFSEQKIICGKH